MIELIVDPRDPELEPLGVAADGSRVRSYTATIRPSRTVRLTAGGFLSSMIPAPKSATTDEPVSFTVPATNGSEILATDRSTFTYTVDVEVAGSNSLGRSATRRLSFTGMLPSSLGASVQVTALTAAEPLPVPFISVQQVLDEVESTVLEQVSTPGSAVYEGILLVAETGGGVNIVPSAGTTRAVIVGRNYLTLTSASCTIALPSSPGIGLEVFVSLKQGGAGNRAVTWGAVHWPYDVVPALLTTAGAVDEFSLRFDGSVWRGMQIASYS